MGRNFEKIIQRAYRKAEIIVPEQMPKIIEEELRDEKLREKLKRDLTNIGGGEKRGDKRGAGK